MIVESFVTGRDYRCLVIDGKIAPVSLPTTWSGTPGVLRPPYDHYRVVAGESYEPGFPLEWGDAAGAFRAAHRRAGGAAAVLHLGMPEVVRDAGASSTRPSPALGQAVADAGLATAVVGYAGLQERPGASPP